MPLHGLEPCLREHVARGVAVDASCNVYVTGLAFGTLDLGTGPLTSTSELAVFVARVAP